MAQQVLLDIGTVCWVVLWVITGIAVRRVVETVATPGQQMSQWATSMAGDMSNAAQSAQSVPIVGDKLRVPFDSLASAMASLQQYADSVVGFVQVVALVAGIVTFAVPVAIWLWKWLPWRIRFAYESSKAIRLLAADGAIELFALRAMAMAPLSALAKVTSNPIHAWQTGDEAVMRQLADVELKRVGLALPPRRRGAVRPVRPGS